MRKYEKPVVVTNDELAEGIFMHSGEFVGKGNATCDSAARNYKYDSFDCRGCSQDRNYACHIAEEEYDAGQYLPTWEKEGYASYQSYCEITGKDR